MDYVRSEHGYSLARACRLVGISRSAYRYTSVRDDTAVAGKLSELAARKPMEGQDKLFARIRSEGIPWNRKRVCRVYRLLGMNVRKRTRKRLPARERAPLSVPEGPNLCWSMDFMHDVLSNGRKFRTLNIMDDYSREALRVEPFLSIGAELVARILERLVAERGRPLCIRVDNGPEFVASALADWCSARGIRLRHIQPGRPMQNGYIERFNRSFRQDVLDANLFSDLMQVRELSEEFVEDYNHHRPHESLGNMSPVAYRLAHDGFSKASPHKEFT